MNLRKATLGLVLLTSLASCAEQGGGVVVTFNVYETTGPNVEDVYQALVNYPLSCERLKTVKLSANCYPVSSEDRNGIQVVYLTTRGSNIEVIFGYRDAYFILWENPGYHEKFKDEFMALLPILDNLGADYLEVTHFSATEEPSTTEVAIEDFRRSLLD